MEYKLYLDGKFVDASSGRTLGIINPATEEVIREIPYGNRSDAAAAFASATRAYDGWRKLTAYDRARPLYRTAELIRARADDIARTLTQEVGKPHAESKGETLAAAAQFEWYAEEVKRRWGEWVPASAPEKRLLTLRMPIGVTAAIAPWNFPLLLISRKIAPALAVGCTAVGRPASQTPLATMEIWNCIHEAGFPPGVANLVCCPPADFADEAIENPNVRKISFTGSVPVGKELWARAGKNLKRLSLELGGHSPFIVCDDVDPTEAAKKAVTAKFRNMGQVCISPSRFFVPESMRLEFETAAAKFASGLRLGNGLDPATEAGPVHDAIRRAECEALVEDAVKQGARLLAGGKRPTGPQYAKGFWFEPTVLSGMTTEMVIMREEPFAPILPIIGYEKLPDAVKMANDTPFGLAAYVLTRDLGRAIRLGEELEAGIVGINDVAPAAAQVPFGGMKESGVGREGGREGVDAYTEMKYLSIVI